MGKRELVALLNLSSLCPVMVERLFLAVPQGCLRFVIVVYPDHTHLLFLPTGVSIDKYIDSFLSKLFKDLKWATLYQECSNCFACNLFSLYREIIKKISIRNCWWDLKIIWHR